MNRFYSILILIVLVACGSSKKTTSNKLPPLSPRKVKVETKSPNSQVNNLPVKSVETKPVIKKDSVKSKTEVLEATSKVKVTAQMVNDYVDKFKEIAKHNMREHGVPASITLAQAILESGAGTGALCLKANNHFGIKCHKEWGGDSVSHDDDAPQECFRKYEEPSQSFTDHSLFLTSRPWYAPLFKLQKNDYKGWAFGLKKSGYATDPKYPNKLIGLIEKYQLNRFDAEVLGLPFETTTLNNTDEQITLPVEDNTYVVAAGDTLYSISKKYNVTVDFLKVKNNLLDNALSIGQKLIIK